MNSGFLKPSKPEPYLFLPFLFLFLSFSFIFFLFLPSIPDHSPFFSSFDVDWASFGQQPVAARPSDHPQPLTTLVAAPSAQNNASLSRHLAQNTRPLAAKSPPPHDQRPPLNVPRSSSRSAHLGDLGHAQAMRRSAPDVTQVHRLASCRTTSFNELGCPLSQLKLAQINSDQL